MKRVVIIGGGPAGLTAAYALMKASVPSVVLEQDAQVGGHARTVDYNWSGAMVPEPGTTCLGLEYFCNEGDWLWSSKDERLVEIARSEIVKLGFAGEADVFDGAVVRQKKAYPVYGPAYRGHLDRLKEYLLRFENLQLVGRNGLHKYNNQDHAMLTALLAVKNLLGERHDVWGVNTEEEYHESQAESGPTAE